MRAALRFLYRLVHLDLDASLQRIEANLIKLREELRDAMTATKAQFDTLLSTFNTETNALSTRLEGLKTQLAAALANGDRSLTVAEAQEIFDGLSSVSSRLQALAADPTNPVPGGDNPPVPATAG